MLRALPLALFALLLAGCDSGTTPDDTRLTCEDVDLSSRGSLTASTPSGAFRATCFEVRGLSDEVVVEGLDLDFSDLAIGDAGGIRLDIAGTQPGTYVVQGESFPRSSATFRPTSSTTLEAASGTITLSEFSAERVRGTFSFVTSNGTAVSSGAFDIPQ